MRRGQRPVVKISKTRFYFPAFLICGNMLFISLLLIFLSWKSPLDAQVASSYSTVDSADVQNSKGTAVNELHGVMENTSTYPVIFHGSRDTKEVALTFDADMTPGMKEMLLSGKVKSYYDPRIISILEKTQTKATLFLTGMWIELYPDITRQLAQNSLFELANHSYSHGSFAGYCYGLHQIPDTEFQDEITKTQDLLQTIAGVSNTYFRFPGGCFDDKSLKVVTSLGLTPIQWESAGVDGFNYSTDNVIHNVLDHVKNGSVIILHMNGAPNDPVTEEALPSIIQELKARGYNFVKISELLSQ